MLRGFYDFHLEAGTGPMLNRFPLARARGGTRARASCLSNKYLKAILGTAALSASRSKNTYLAANYRSIAARRGPRKAIVALEHSILTAVWRMLADGECYADPGADQFTRLDPTKAKNNAVRKLNSTGFDVTITPATAAWPASRSRERNTNSAKSRSRTSSICRD